MTTDNDAVEAVLIQYSDGAAEWVRPELAWTGEARLLWGMADGSVRWKDPR